MAKKPVGKAKLAPKTHGKIAIIAKELAKQMMVDGLTQYTLEGIIEAKWKIAGMANLLLRLGNKLAAAEVANEAAQMDGLLNSDNARAEVWQNLKEALESGEPEEISTPKE
jgi:hypothetical protein